MGGDPITALNIVGFPKGQMDVEILADILKGGIERATEAGAVVIGGHTIIDPELKYGMAVTGVIHPDRVLRNVGVREGDALVLTKPLGTGIVTTALKQRKASPAHVRAAVRSMVTLNKTASRIARTFRVHACSDVTGFGLLGHAAEMAMGSGVTLDARLAASSRFSRARVKLAGRGFLTGGCRRNRAYLEDKVVVDPAVEPELTEIAFDPQTSGGLLLALEPKAAARLVDTAAGGRHRIGGHRRPGHEEARRVGLSHLRTLADERLELQRPRHRDRHGVVADLVVAGLVVHRPGQQSDSRPSNAFCASCVASSRTSCTSRNGFWYTGTRSFSGWKK